MSNRFRIILNNIMVLAYLVIGFYFKQHTIVQIIGLGVLGVSTLTLSLVYTYTNRPLSKKELWGEIIANLIISVFILYFIFRLQGV